MILCEAIFDAEPARKQLAEFEAKTSDPNFWNDQEKAQAVLQERKQLEDRVNAEKTLDSKTSDIETYIHLAQEESDDAQRASLLEDLARELAAADTYLAELETKTLLAGETDRLNACLLYTSLPRCPPARIPARRRQSPPRRLRTRRRRLLRGMPTKSSPVARASLGFPS